MFFLKARKEKAPVKLNIKKIDIWSIVIILFGSFSFLGIMFFSGWQTKDGMQFIGVNASDGIRHFAYIDSQTIFFPPQQPGYSGISLRGFHYFYDFMLSRFLLFYPFSLSDLSFRLFPLFLSLLYGGSFYLFSSLITKDLLKRRLILFFAYFSQGFSSIILIFNKNINLGDGVVQPIALIINPFIVLSIGILLTGLALVPRLKISWKYALIIGLLLGILSQIKAYTGLVGIMAISLYSVFLFITNKKVIGNYLLLLFLTAFLTIITFFPNNYGSGGLLYAPLLYYKHYAEQPIFDFWHWGLKWIIFKENNNWIRLAELYLEAIFAFYFLSLGIRVIIFAKINKIFKLSFWKNEYNFLLISSIIPPILITFLFVQRVYAFEIQQFLWVAVSLLSIPSGLVLGDILLNKSKLTKSFTILLLILLSLSGFLSLEKEYLNNKSPFVVNNAQLSTFNHVSRIVPKDSFIVYIPRVNTEKDDFNWHISPLVAAFTKKPVYFESGGLPFVKEDDIAKERSQNLLNLHKSLLSCDKDNITKTLGKIGSKYLVTYNLYPCLSTNSAMLKKIKSGEINFYEFK